MINQDEARIELDRIELAAKFIIRTYADCEGDIDIAEIDGAIDDECDDPSPEMLDIAPNASKWIDANFDLIRKMAIKLR